MDLPMTKMSGWSPQARVAPPAPAENVCVSSIISSAPYLVASSRRPSMKPGSGSTMPMLVRAGSVRIAATSPWDSASSTAARSFQVTALVVRSRSTGVRRCRGGSPPCRPGRQGERLVDRAVVAVGEHEHLRAAQWPAGPAGSPSGSRRWPRA